MIAGCARESLFDEALYLFIELQVSGLCPAETTMMSIISVVSDLGLLSVAKKIHGYAIRNEFSLDSRLGAALIDMYSKCGSIYSALQLFENIPNKNVGHWTSMIVGFSVHGCAEASLHLFAQMQKCGVKPNYVTFIGVLSACSHGGLVGQGIKHFNLMKRYNIEPRIQHYGCLVDLLGRSGMVKEAKMVIDNMPMEPAAVIWSILLAVGTNLNLTAQFRKLR
ncbi:Pentatricopeptide repeat-containing protein, partial [Thalictrum thalictroides]